MLLETQQDCEFIEADIAASAKHSPKKRVPYLSDGDIELFDSSSFVKYLRETNGQHFLADINDFNLFCLANTLLDTAINLFFLEKDGMDESKSKYLSRQTNRIQSLLKEVNKLSLPHQAPYLDSQLRLACFLDWGIFRARISLEEYPNPLNFLQTIGENDSFYETQPPHDG